MPKTIKVEVYRWSELSEHIREKVKKGHIAIMGYAYAHEAMASITAVANRFYGAVTDYNVDFFGCGPSSMTFNMPNSTAEEIDAILNDLGDCNLTGYCADEAAINGFKTARKGGEADLDALMHAAFETWLKQAQADCHDQYSDDRFSEHCDANDYWFFENGTFVA
jgi:hypothetical protein